MTTASADTQYALTQDQLDFQAMVRQVTQERIVPRAPEIDAKAEYPWDIRELFKDLNIFALPFDEEYGGTGTGTLMLNVAIEEISKGCASCGLMLAVHELS